MNNITDIHQLIPLVCVNHTLLSSTMAYVDWIDGYQTWPAQIVTEALVDQTFKDMATKIASLTWETGGNSRVCFISILKGGLYTQYRILSYLPQTSLFIGHIGRSSYRTQTRASKLKVTYDLDLNPDLVRGSFVWLIDDIADTGNTIFSAYDAIAKYNPKQICIATLINKQWKNTKVNCDVTGFTTGKGYDPFLVGCGMGLGDVYRNLSTLYEVQFEGNI